MNASKAVLFSVKNVNPKITDVLVIGVDVRLTDVSKYPKFFPNLALLTEYAKDVHMRLVSEQTKTEQVAFIGELGMLKVMNSVPLGIDDIVIYRNVQQ